MQRKNNVKVFCLTHIILPLMVMAQTKYLERQPSDILSTVNEFGFPSKHQFNKDMEVSKKNKFYMLEVERHKNTYEFDTSPPKNFKKLRHFPSLTNKGRGAEKVNLPFQFPFYSASVSSIYITTEGFLSMGTMLHGDMHQYSYLAPLMADFIPSNKTGKILMTASNDHVTFEWKNMILEADPRSGYFTFSCILYRNGQIQFYYEKFPDKNVTEYSLGDMFKNESSGSSSERVNNSYIQTKAQHGIGDGNQDNTKVTVGISDSTWIHNMTTGHVSIIGKSKLSVNLFDIFSGTKVMLTPLTDCTNRNSCFTCLDEKLKGNCTWCAERMICFNEANKSSTKSIIENSNCTFLNKGTQNYCIYEERAPPNYILGEEQSSMAYYQIHWLDHELLKMSKLRFRHAFLRNVSEVPDKSLPFLINLPFPFPYFNIISSTAYLQGDGSISLISDTSVNIMGTTKNGPPLMNLSDGGKKFFNIRPIGLSLHSTPLSRVFYGHDETSMSFQWRNYASDLFQNITFTYKVTMFKNGIISFAYDKLTISLSNTKDATLGLFTENEDPRLNVNLSPYARYIHGNTEIVLVHRITCSAFTECQACVDFAMECNWNSNLKTCLDQATESSSDYGEDALRNRTCTTPNIHQLDDTHPKQKISSSNIMPHGERVSLRVPQDASRQPENGRWMDNCKKHINCTTCMENFRKNFTGCFWCHGSMTCDSDPDKCHKNSQGNNASWHPLYIELLSYGLTYLDYCSYEHSLEMIPLNSIYSNSYRIHHIGVVVIMLLLIVIVTGLAIWAVWYGWKNRNSNLGRLLTNLTRSYTLLRSVDKRNSDSEWQLTEPNTTEFDIG